MIYYLVPSSEKPSWGLAILYSHVRMLLDHDIPACIVKEGAQSPPAWLDIKVIFQTHRNFKKDFVESDTIIVPEVMVGFEGLKKMKARKILFVQAGGFLFQSIPSGETHKSLGFEHVWIILPHMQDIVDRHIGLPYTTIPAFVASYFFNGETASERKRQVLLFPKFEQVDYSIVEHILQQHLLSINQSRIKNLVSRRNWQVKEVKGLSHKQVALEMKRSAFFISINTFEALNTSVIEAMAAGCIVFCYEGFGPRDYLENGSNAIVFPNNEAYLLAETIIRWIDDYEELSEALTKMRQRAAVTASRYREEETRKALCQFFDT